MVINNANVLNYRGFALCHEFVRQPAVLLLYSGACEPKINSTLIKTNENASKDTQGDRRNIRAQEQKGQGAI